jgi:tetratricopeptide (TPR) repeat protein
VDAIRISRSGRKPGLILACCCGVILLTQVIALYCAQSRGPVLGLATAGYICIFIFLVLKRTSEKSRPLSPWVAAGLGLIAPVLLGITARIIPKLPASLGMACLGAAAVFIAAGFFLLWGTAWGRNWLWLTWLVQTAALVLVFALSPTLLRGDGIRTIPSLGRFAQFSSGSVDVRRFLWQTGYNAMKSGAPAMLPGGTRDAFYFLRPAIGYGPESISFAANFHGDPQLIRMHTSEAVDRLHNETFDNLISLGFAGAVLNLFVFAAAIFSSLRYLDLLRGRREKILFSVFLACGIGAGALMPWLAGAPHMIGVGIPAGLLAGLIAHVGWCGCLGLPASSTGNPRQILVLCILGALMAHFVETAVGIAVTPTRTCYFLLLAVVCVLASGDVAQPEPAKRRASRPLPWFQSPLFPFAAIASFVVLVEAWCFIINTTTQRSAWALFLKTWIYRPEGSRMGLPLPGALVLLLLTICGSIGLMRGEESGPGSSKDSTWRIARISLSLMILVWLFMGLLAAKLWAALDPSASSPMNMSLHAEARITLFLSGLLLLLATGAWSVVATDSQRYATAARVRSKSLWVGLLFAAGAFALVFQLTVRPAWADIACRIAHIYESSGDAASASQLYKRAADLAPHTIPYRISLGFAQGKAGASNAGQLQETIRSLQRALDLNPLDPASQRSLGSLLVQMGEQAHDPGVRDAEIRKAIPYFEQAIRLAPNHPDAHNDLGRCYFLLGDHAKAEGFYEESLRMYPNYAPTHIYMGEMQYRLKDLEGALRSFSTALRLDRKNVEARKNVGFLLALLGRTQEAIQSDLYALKIAPRDPVLLRRLSSLCFAADDYNAGLDFARRAYDAAPAAERGSFDAFVEALKQAPLPATQHVQ